MTAKGTVALMAGSASQNTFRRLLNVKNISLKFFVRSEFGKSILSNIIGNALGGIVAGAIVSYSLNVYEQRKSAQASFAYEQGLARNFYGSAKKLCTNWSEREDSLRA